MKFETAALTTKAMELWSLSTKEKSFKYHNSTQDYSPPPHPPPSEYTRGQILRDDTRMWVRIATAHKLTAAGAGGSERKRLWLIIIPNISHLHALLWTANSRLLFILLSKVFSLYRVRVCGWVRSSGQRVRNSPLGLNARHSGMCQPLLCRRYVLGAQE